MQNYPNPFNPETWIPFQLKELVELTIFIYDIHGQLVRQIGLGNLPAGVYVDKNKAVHWNGRNDKGERVSTGVYFYTLQADDYRETKRMLILK
jgi:flagellar hook assembly protein FlgD